MNLKKLYGETSINEEDSDDPNRRFSIYLKYYKTRVILEKSNEKKYGIEITKEEVEGKNKTKEKTAAKYLSDSEQVIDRLLKLLVENKVTPIATNDILSDLSKNPAIIYNEK